MTDKEKTHRQEFNVGPIRRQEYSEGLVHCFDGLNKIIDGLWLIVSARYSEDSKDFVEDAFNPGTYLTELVDALGIDISYDRLEDIAIKLSKLRAFLTIDSVDFQRLVEEMQDQWHAERMEEARKECFRLDKREVMKR